MKTYNESNRRKFLTTSAVATTGLLAGSILHGNAASPRPVQGGLYQLGPMEGYSMHIGTLLSSMNMMRTWIVEGVKDLSVEQLDWQLDDQSNSIGAMPLHLAATERYYQLNTFDEMKWGTWSDEIKAECAHESGRTCKGKD